MDRGGSQHARMRVQRTGADVGGQHRRSTQGAATLFVIDKCEKSSDADGASRESVCERDRERRSSPPVGSAQIPATRVASLRSQPPNRRQAHGDWRARRCSSSVDSGGVDAGELRTVGETTRSWPPSARSVGGSDGIPLASSSPRARVAAMTPSEIAGNLESGSSACSPGVGEVGSNVTRPAGDGSSRYYQLL